MLKEEIQIQNTNAVLLLVYKSGKESTLMVVFINEFERQQEP